MHLDKAREVLQTQVEMGSGYNRNAARLILAEVHRVHGQDAVDKLIREMDLATAFGFHAGTEFKAP